VSSCATTAMTTRHLRYRRLPHILDRHPILIPMWHRSVHGEPHCRDCQDKKDYG
jgi:hypothetical protein